jgi:SAM-dependent methyltransferase
MSSEAEGIVDLYQRKALDWVRKREHGGGLMEQAWLDRFRALMPPNGSVLDIGCGSAVPIARYLIETGHSVTGVDTSSTFIGLCRERYPAQEWLLADMRTLALARPFDGILAWDSFFHLTPDDQRRMFPVFRKHAAVGAALMFTSGTGHGDRIGSFEGEPLYHGSLDPAEYRSLLDQHGFRVVSHVVEDIDCGRHTIWLAQRV